MRIRLFAIALALSSALIAQRASPPATSTDDRIGVVEKKLKQSPTDAAVKDELVGAYLQKMRETADGSYLDRAVRIVDAVLMADPSNYPARRRRIEIDMQMHRFKEVVTMAGELRQKSPNDVIVLGLEGDALMEMGDYDAAADTYQKMVDLKPSLASYNRVAFYRFVTGDSEGAIDLMRKAIRMGSPLPENTAWCLNELGGMLLKKNSLDEAELAYKRALAIFPGYHRALAGLGMVQASRERYEDAANLFLRAQAVAPFPEYSGWLAKLYVKLGKQDLAQKQIALLDLSDKLGKAAGEAANRNLALAYADLGHNKTRALELAKAELEIRRDVYTYDALAWVLFKTGQIEQAASTVGKSLAQNTPEPMFHQHAAEIFEAAGRKEEALAQRKIVASLNPKFELASKTETGS